MSSLAEVRDRYENDREIAKYAGITLTLEDYDWLIEQAERTEHLKRENAGLHDILAQIEYQEKDKLLAENKRYRESLVFINEELEFVLHSNKGFAEKVFYIENSKRKITEALEENNEPR